MYSTVNINLRTYVFLMGWVIFIDIVAIFLKIKINMSPTFFIEYFEFCVFSHFMR